MSEEKDKEFEPTIEMMIHDFDDEQTLEEEERQAAAEAGADNELDDLQREGDMPLEQLLAMYYNQPMAMDEEESVEDDADTTNKTNADESKAESDLEDEESDLKRLYPVGVNSLSAILAAAEESDVDYEPDESDNRKKIMIGVEHQAQIPEIGETMGSDKSDQLIWSPYCMAEEAVVAFLQKIKQNPRATDSAVTWASGDVVPSNSHNASRHIRDDEKALATLQESSYDTEKASDRLKEAQNSSTDEKSSCWSEEECTNFEAGLLAHGKNFHEIRATKVPGKSVGEIIQFYYHWKKSERYDAFVSKNNRFDKKKYNANSGPVHHGSLFGRSRGHRSHGNRQQWHEFARSRYTFDRQQ
ncbi:mesoderm induction early response protein 1-like [Culicoides brevitarsis]|uniref:mesoderm induction early response protein 1-like n=1 Tax=Culicoides brevitarsis TaxID=469753 RepID=UPI00307CA9A2